AVNHLVPGSNPGAGAIFFCFEKRIGLLKLTSRVPQVHFGQFVTSPLAFFQSKKIQDLFLLLYQNYGSDYRIFYLSIRWFSR
ncbi:MAG: hypothetical protein IKD09_07600, partial [Lentisphaeria bacterium]|nr:hypothetical protein [Lentisphaeria bacterium]